MEKSNITQSFIKTMSLIIFLGASSTLINSCNKKQLNNNKTEVSIRYTRFTDVFIYDTKPHTLEVINLPEEGVKVSYTGTTSATDIGTYEATATFTLTDPNKYQWESGEEVVNNKIEKKVILTIKYNNPDEFTLVGGTITGYTGQELSIAIPPVINGVKVTAIGTSAFYLKSIVSVVIPNGITSIGRSAFADCWNLTNVVIPNSVESIGESTFASCLSLDNITIPNGVITIGKYAFNKCIALTNITIGNTLQNMDATAFLECTKLMNIQVVGNNPNYTTEDGILYSFDKSTLVAYPRAKTESSYNIPKSIKKIASYACYSCSNLTNVIMGDNVESIDDYAFWGCSKLESLNLPNSLMSIGAATFYGCNNLTNLTIGNNVTTIGKNAFRDCSKLTSITIPNSVTDIQGSVFENCSSLTNLTIGNNVTNIGASAFYGCSNLSNIIIPNKVTTIGDFAFGGCSGLTQITIPSNVTRIGDFVFGDCSKLLSITMEMITPPIFASRAFENSSPTLTIYIPLSSNNWNYSTSLARAGFQGTVVGGK